MIEGLPPYPQMKESGLPWLGDVPAHWEVRRNGRLFGPRRETGFPNLPILEVSIRTGVRIRSFEDGGRKQEMSDRSKYQRAVRGDIAYNMMRIWQGAVGIAPVDGLVSPAYVVARPFPETDAAYYAYLFRTALYMRETDTFSRGIVPDRNRLYWESFKQMPSVWPPLDEQRLIVRFLDWHGAQTAKLIRVKKRLIALLNEQKQSIIHRAVTRGVDPKVKLRPSDILWLGGVPETWEIRRLKDVARLRSGESITALQIEEQGRFPVYGGNGLRGYTSRQTHEGEFVLIGRQGALCGNINYATGRFFASEHAVVVHPRSRLKVRWLGELLRLMNLNQYSVAAAQPGLSVERIENLKVPVPPFDEQAAIARTFDEQTANLSASISATDRENGLIQEFRNRLIADVVTGKLDVRAVAASLPDVAALEPVDEASDADLDEEAMDETHAEDVAA
jgi:type I restriction enzyme S subunit